MICVSETTNHFLPFTYPGRCFQKRYPANLPTASIVICFHNEEFNALFRTMFGVVNLTPRLFLEEIILVDDMSDSGKTELHPSTSRALTAISDGAWVLLLLILHLMGVEAGALGSPVGM